MEIDDLDSLIIVDGDIIHRQNIIRLLRIGITQQWSFSCVKKEKSRIINNSITLLSVDSGEGLFAFRAESSDVQNKLGKKLMFRGESGGLSIVFQARKADLTHSNELQKTSSFSHFYLPYKVACTQLRKAVRVNLESKMQVPVTLHMVNGAIVEGLVMDISSSGVKIRAKQNLETELGNPDTIDACKIDFGTEFELLTGIQVVGIVDDDDAEVSLLRCQFIQIEPEDEGRLKDFIGDVIQSTDSVELVIREQE